MINDHHLILPHAPFGGYKQSGVGREHGIYGLLEYTQIKHIHVDIKQKREGRLIRPTAKYVGPDPRKL